MAAEKGPILVSACLAGIPCRYDGQARGMPEIVALVREGRAVPVCPEILGGLSTPRPPAEIIAVPQPSALPGNGSCIGASTSTADDPNGSDDEENTAPGSQVWNGNARVQTETGADVTRAYVQGALEVLRIARQVNAKLAVFKERSPSCGVRAVYDGSFRGRLRSGFGVTTALLRRHGIAVINEEEFKQEQAAVPMSKRFVGGSGW